MKRIIIIVLLLISTFLLARENVNLTSIELLKNSIDISTPKTMVITTEQIVYFYTGKKETFEIKSWSKDGNDKMLFVYQRPRRIRGNKFLFLKDGDIWAYFSKTGRIRRIASSAKKSKMQGSDFSYEDVSMMSSLVEDFFSEIIKEEKFEGKNCYVLELKPKDKKNISYNKLLCWIDKKDYVLRKMEFYNDNKLSKFMIQKDYKKNKNYLIPYTTIMKSVKNDTKTESYIKKIEVDVEIQDRKFNKNALDR